MHAHRKDTVIFGHLIIMIQSHGDWHSLLLHKQIIYNVSNYCYSVTCHTKRQNVIQINYRADWAHRNCTSHCSIYNIDTIH